VLIFKIRVIRALKTKSGKTSISSVFQPRSSIFQNPRRAGRYFCPKNVKQMNHQTIIKLTTTRQKRALAQFLLPFDLVWPDFLPYFYAIFNVNRPILRDCRKVKEGTGATSHARIQEKRRHIFRVLVIRMLNYLNCCLWQLNSRLSKKRSPVWLAEA
jgi:hypothetical protein